MVFLHDFSYTSVNYLPKNVQGVLCCHRKQKAPFPKGELGRIDRFVHHPLLLHWFHLISGLTKEIDHAIFSRQMAGTDYEEGSLLWKELLHLFLPV